MTARRRRYYTRPVAEPAYAPETSDTGQQDGVEDPPPPPETPEPHAPEYKE